MEQDVKRLLDKVVQCKLTVLVELNASQGAYESFIRYRLLMSH